MIMSAPHKTLLCWTCLLAISLPAAAEPSATALDNAGHIVRVLDGTYGELFPENDALAAERPLLVLDLETAGGELSRRVVPGTGDARVESDARLIHDAAFDTTTVLWLSTGPGGGILVRFATFDGTRWSAVHTLRHDEAAVFLRHAPRVAVTHDAFDLELADGDTVGARRRIIHLLWQRLGAAPATMYTALIFVEGVYVGWSESFALDDDFLLAGGASEPGTVSAELQQAASLQVADDGTSVLVTFTNRLSQRLGALEILPLPLELELLGDAVREEIWNSSELFDPDNLGSFADGVAGHVVLIGARLNLHPAIVEYISNTTRDWISESGGAYGWDLESLGHDARAVTVETSSEVYTWTDVDPTDPGAQITHIDLGDFLDGLEDGEEPSQILDIEVLADRPAPVTGAGETAVYTSKDGRGLLVVWQDAAADRLLYVESRHDIAGGAWSAPRALPFGERLALPQAHQLLRDKIR